MPPAQQSPTKQQNLQISSSIHALGELHGSQRQRQELVQDTISHWRRDLPEPVINFTDATPLAHRPIAFSIETKKLSAGCDGAKLQLGIWQNAHWTFLRHLAQITDEMCTAAEKTAAAGPETDQQDKNTGDESTAQKAFELPTFIPGIIVQEHFWHLIIAAARSKDNDMAKHGHWEYAEYIEDISYCVHIASPKAMGQVHVLAACLEDGSCRMA
ncbi:hypothetical protein F53441_3974 [Fusarium austroafricanum]|uniref:PD-(D/E)XK nuclease-like domain-containing protein n=1 Tax=Fusarium austroafricanum TaxID=2364996 RepID=A0A8H4P284_9HYPO|nr:hypothetical protein F53441_3974 [Fusarium austroafricanum]